MLKARAVMVFAVIALSSVDPATPQTADTTDAPSTPFDFLVQLPNQVGGFFSDTDCDSCQGGVEVLAENFEWDSDVCFVQLWGGYLPGNAPPQDSFSVVFHDDAGGVPGPVVASYSGISASRNATGNTVLGVEEYEYSFSLDPPVELSGSVSNWVQIYNDTQGSSESFFWETGDLDPDSGLPGYALALESPGSNWQAVPDSELALVMIGGGCGGIPAVDRWGLTVLAITLLAVAGLALRKAAAPLH